MPFSRLSDGCLKPGLHSDLICQFGSLDSFLQGLVGIRDKSVRRFVHLGVGVATVCRVREERRDSRFADV